MKEHQEADDLERLLDPDFELVQVHLATGDRAEVTIRDKHHRLVFSGILCMVDNPGQYYPSDYFS